LTKKLFIKTYGCQMNVYDSDRMADTLTPLGYQLCDEPKDANLIILNTCHIREKAADKMYSDLGRYRPFKEEKKARGAEGLIVVAGCTAQAEGSEITKRAPYVDVVMGPQTYHRLPEMILKIHRKTGKSSIINTDFPVESKFDHLPEIVDVKGTTAFLSVQEGCDKMCTFCIVPYTRGAEFSRPVEDILKEAKRLIELGAKEITLLGQNVTAFHGKMGDGEWKLSDLIYELAGYEGLDRIRYTTSHPRDMQEDIIAAHRDIDKLMPYLHLPFQSGSNRILKLMNRKHTHEEYRDLVHRIRDARPDIAFSTDIIVGFPGESDRDFADTMKLVEDIKFSQAYSFKYSIRHGTPAALMDLQVPEKVKDERLQTLQALLRQQQDEFNASMIGSQFNVLFEKPGKYDNQIVGKSPYLQAVHVDGDQQLIGSLKQVKIIGRGTYSLRGELVD
jgi:tRNA-2-methylthio-N6-dimethylallyladenosine synthase